MIVKLNKPLLDLEGNPSEHIQGKLLAQLLGASHVGDPVTLWSWAIAFHRGIDIELSDADVKWLREFITNHSVLTVASKAQLLGELA